MATIENNYTGSTDTTYSFTFPYMNESDVKVSKNEVLLTKGSGTTEYTQAATSITLGAAPLTTDKIRIYRSTSDSNLTATFYPGSSIRSSDLNDNFTQNLYSTQENTHNTTEALDNSRELSDGVYTSAISIAKDAKDVADAADAIADGAKESADDAIAATNALVATNSGTDSEPVWVLQGDGSNTTTNNKGVKYAVEKADDAVSTADDADANATTALNNSRESDGSGGYTSAISIANTAKATSETALDNSRESDGSGGYNIAISIAKSAQDTVSASAVYTVVANHAELPALSSLSEDKFYQISDSTGIEDETDVSGEPSGFKGDDELAVKLKSNIAADPKRWDWQEYYATDPEIRYRKKLVVENLRTISENYTIGSDNNAFSIGPVTISSGATIEIPENSKYVVMN